MATHIKTNLSKTLLHYDYWVSVPYHPMKLYKRGYNVVEQLFRPLMETYDIHPLLLLKRTQNTTALFSKNAVQRQTILQKSIELNTKIPTQLINKKILIIDDIVTTKSTMTTCINLIKYHYPSVKISCLSLIKA